MSNPYSSPDETSAAAAGRLPIIHQISWPATLLRYAVFAGVIGLAYCIAGPDGILWGAAVCLLYMIGSRRLIPRAHNRAMKLLRNGRIELAIKAYEEGYAFFSRHPWVDRFRALTIMSSSASSYREIALCNIAFCHIQLGNGQAAKRIYGRALEEFPNCELARSALRLIESVESPSPEQTSPPLAHPIDASGLSPQEATAPAKPGQPDTHALARRLIETFHLSVAERAALPDGKMPRGSLFSAAEQILTQSNWLPPGASTDGPFDGVRIELRSDGCTIHEQHEIGVMRFSELQSHPADTLEEAIDFFLERTFGDQFDGIRVDKTR